MINSILNRKPKRIILDRLLITNEEGNHNLTIDQNTIKNAVTQHFQQLGSASTTNLINYSTINDLPIQWQSLYNGKPSIKEEWYNELITPITLQELRTTISLLPNNKAGGPSSIKYEDIVHLDDYTIEFLLNLYNIILTYTIFPTEWSEALLFPIPKPKDWEGDINNTHPIVLLETTRRTNRPLYFRTSN
ncbi:hypothetical protein C1645_821740 [Glomus cerebriforme]|uniref:Reverse transcriptase domain-containing protein n=1 Tax=Glomus cerebriforme TaxID=658196 RepID=A0A397SZL7_9GLOM|nr:hypothetical protein C1645_821740 [Glomus cerebriforme]